jgi:hypothetical protein
MTGARTYIRLLRHMGIALIFAPEPFTTPFGVAAILAARHLAKRHELSVNNRLRETVQYYLAHTGHPSDYAGDESRASVPVKRRGLSAEQPILGQITGSCSLGAEPSIRQGGRDIQRHSANYTAHMESLSRRYNIGNSLSDTSVTTQKVIHHTTDTEWLSRRYLSANLAVAHSAWATTSVGVEGVTHHSLNVGSFSQRYGTGSIGQPQAKPHATGVSHSRQHYGSAVNSLAVLRALRNNNHYYEVLSRKNVIGGH